MGGGWGSDLSLLENYLIRYKLQADPAKLADGVEGKAPRRSPRALSLDAPQERVVIAQPTGPPQTYARNGCQPAHNGNCAPHRRDGCGAIAWMHARRLFEYPHGERGAVIITTEDEWRLSDGEFLNDSLIDFGIKWTINHRADSAVLQRFQVYNTFFHRKLHELWYVMPPAATRWVRAGGTVAAKADRCSRGPAGRHWGAWGVHSSASSEIRKRPQDELFAAMKRWVKEDIFTKDFLLIPMNERCGAVSDGSVRQGAHMH